MAQMGRPKKVIDMKIFENLCAIQCTELEICDWFECCEDTLNSWCKENYTDEDGKPMTFSEVFKQKRNKGKSSLRRNQWKLAETNATMAIFLGKQYLGQSDNGQIDIPTDKDGNEDELSKAMRELAEEMNDNADIE